MLNIVFAVTLFALWAADVWGQREIWLLWGIVNLVIGCTFVIARAVRESGR